MLDKKCGHMFSVLSPLPKLKFKATNPLNLDSWKTTRNKVNKNVAIYVKINQMMHLNVGIQLAITIYM